MQTFIIKQYRHIKFLLHTLSKVRVMLGFVGHRELGRNRIRVRVMELSRRRGRQDYD